MEEPTDLNETLSFEILFLNIMWWFADGIGHDQIYLGYNLDIDALIVEANKFLPTYLHVKKQILYESF